MGASLSAPGSPCRSQKPLSVPMLLGRALTVFCTSLRVPWGPCELAAFLMNPVAGIPTGWWRPCLLKPFIYQEPCATAWSELRTEHPIRAASGLQIPWTQFYFTAIITLSAVLWSHRLLLRDRPGASAFATACAAQTLFSRPGGVLRSHEAFFLPLRGYWERSDPLPCGVQGHDSPPGDTQAVSQLPAHVERGLGN